MKSIRLTWVAGVFLLAATASALQAQEPLGGAEQQAMADTMQYALENNRTSQSSEWVNPDTGRSGAVVPTRTFDNAQGQPCREFLTTIIIGDREEQGYGTACRQPDGSWQLVSDAGHNLPPPPAAPVNVYSMAPPPPVYYGFPAGFYGPSTIYLSFSYVYRSGHVHYGFRYLDGPTFRHRYPVHVHQRVYLGPSLYTRYRIQDEWRYREWERHRDRDRYEYRDKHDSRRHYYREDSHKGRSKGRDDDRREDRR